MEIKTKYSIGEKVLLESGRIETISVIHVGDGLAIGRGLEPKYHFERMWQSFRWESQIIRSMD